MVFTVDYDRLAKRNVLHPKWMGIYHRVFEKEVGSDVLLKCMLYGVSINVCTYISFGAQSSAAFAVHRSKQIQ